MRIAEWTQRYGRIATALVAGAALVAGLAVVDARQVSQRADLTATSIAPRAHGWTMIQTHQTSKTSFLVSARRLAPHTTFDVVVDGVKVGEITTNGGGSGKVRFRNQPRGHDLMLGFDPRQADVSVRDHDGHDCLVGSGPGGDSASGACCLPDTRDDDGDGPCVHLAADACAAAGGVVPEAGSCLPYPCQTQPPVPEVICCIPDSASAANLRHGDHFDDDGDVDCRDVSSADCAAAGGTVVTATSCHPNPCAPMPPADEVACCVTEREGDTDCKHMTTERCTALGGSAAGAFCDPDPCSGTDDDGGDGHGHDGGGGDHHGGGPGGGDHGGHHGGPDGGGGMGHHR